MIKRKIVEKYLEVHLTKALLLESAGGFGAAISSFKENSFFSKTCSTQIAGGFYTVFETQPPRFQSYFSLWLACFVLKNSFCFPSNSLNSRSFWSQRYSNLVMR